MSKGKVVVGMSGGVDSSVCAYLLKEQGYEVIGVTMRIWQDEDVEQVEDNGGCCGLSAVDDARRVCDFLEIPFYVLNFKEEFKKSVIDYFVEEYLDGKTPNPCIACNRYVKWESLLEKAIKLGADYIATGHYARIVQLDNGRFALKTSATAQKDQTYALYNLSQYQLSKTIMPVGEYTKDEVRKIAEQIGLLVANKPDSQEICFIPDNNHGKFIEEFTGKKLKAGNFVDLNGNILGKHKGIANYTIGQRKGLGIAFSKPMYVCEINISKNEVVLCDDEQLFKTELFATDLNFIAIESLTEKMRVTAKIRYSHKVAPCEIEIVDKDLLKCTFETPQRAITPGQAVVFYDQDLVIGGGKIIK